MDPCDIGHLIVNRSRNPMVNAEQIVISIILILIGVIGTLAFQQITNARTVNGLYFKLNDTQLNAVQVAKNIENTGKWICVNVNGMNYKTMVETCQHEAGHEIFAEIVEKHPEKISQVMNVIGKN